MFWVKVNLGTINSHCIQIHILNSIYSQKLPLKCSIPIHFTSKCLQHKEEQVYWYSSNRQNKCKKIRNQIFHSFLAPPNIFIITHVTDSGKDYFVVYYIVMSIKRYNNILRTNSSIAFSCLDVDKRWKEFFCLTLNSFLDYAAYINCVTI